VKRSVPVADVIIFAVPGILFWLLGGRTHLTLLQALGGLLIGLALASLLVGFSPIHMWRARSRKK